jgi:hypothetical protein
LHWPTKVRPRDRAANALYYNGESVSTIGVVNIYCKSVLALPAYAMPKPRIEHCLMMVYLEF